MQFGENARERVSFICNCCGCCCEALLAARRFGFLHPVHTSNFVLALDATNCNGCSKCVDACPVEALSLVSANDPKMKRRKVARLSEDLCLGCGVCVGTCPKDCVRLESRPERVITPLNSAHRVVLQAIERGQLQDLIFDNRALASHRAMAAILGVILQAAAASSGDGEPADAVALPRGADPAVGKLTAGLRPSAFCPPSAPRLPPSPLEAASTGWSSSVDGLVEAGSRRLAAWSSKAIRSQSVTVYTPSSRVLDRILMKRRARCNMTTTRFARSRSSLLAAVLGLTFAAAACGDSTVATVSPASPTEVVQTASAPLASSFSLTDAMAVALQDEYHAEAVYQGVLLDFGSVFPFVNVIEAERTHAASIARLFQSRGLAVPANAWSVASVPRFASVAAACAAAAQAEIDNVAVYDRYLGEDLPFDVRTVFVSNRAASIERHLPAFNRCK